MYFSDFYAFSINTLPMFSFTQKKPSTEITVESLKKLIHVWDKKQILQHWYGAVEKLQTKV